MQILVWGNSPIAGWIAGKLHLAQHQVKWLSDDNIVKNVERFRGLYLQAPNEQTIVRSLPLSSSIDEFLRPPIDWIILAMPTWAISQIAYEMARRIPAKNCPSILIISDGIGAREKVRSLFEETPIIQAFSTRLFQWTILADGQPAYESIISNNRGGIALTASEKDVEAELLFKQAGIHNVKIHPAQSLEWSSLLWQIQVNALPALLRVSPETVYDEEELFNIEYRQLREAIQIIDLQKIPLVDLPEVALRRLGWQIRILPPNLLKKVLRPNIKPSSLFAELSLKTGRSDAAYLNGIVAKTAHDIGIAAPVNYTLAVSVTDIAEGRIMWEQFTLDYLHTLLRIAERHIT